MKSYIAVTKESGLIHAQWFIHVCFTVQREWYGYLSDLSLYTRFSACTVPTIVNIIRKWLRINTINNILIRLILHKYIIYHVKVYTVLTRCLCKKILWSDISESQWNTAIAGVFFWHDTYIVHLPLFMIQYTGHNLLVSHQS